MRVLEWPLRGRKKGREGQFEGICMFLNYLQLRSEAREKKTTIQNHSHKAWRNSDWKVN